MSVEIPDTSGSEGRDTDSKPGRRALLTAVGSLLVVLFIIGGLTRPDVEEEDAASAQEETTTTSIPPLNDPLDWHGDEIGATWPQRLVEFEGSIYFFGIPGRPTQFAFGEGLDAWLLVDGVTWKSLGTAIEPPNEIHTVSATPRGLVAAGSGDDNKLHLWTSIDAVEWHKSDLPEAPTNSQYIRSYAQAIGGTDDVIVLLANQSADIYDVLLDVLPPEVRGDNENPVNFNWGGPPYEITMQGPLGLTGVTLTHEDLGLTEEEARELMGGSVAGTTKAWTSIDGVLWTEVELGIEYVNNNSIVEADGGLIATGYGRSGFETWFSSDGFDWEQVDGVSTVDHLTALRGGFLAVRHLGTAPDIAYSEDRTTWEPLGLSQYLDDDLSWQYQTVVAGEGGIATVISGYDERGFAFEEPEPVVLERDGYELTITGGGSVVLSRGDEVMIRVSTYSNLKYDEVVVDFEQRSVTFLHPETLEPLVTFTFDELEEAETEMNAGYYYAEEEQVIAFSADDGLTWTVESVSDIFGENVVVPSVLVTANQVVAVGAEFSDRFSRVPNSPNIAIWSAVIP